MRNPAGPEGLRGFLRCYLTGRLTSQGREVPKDFGDDYDLLLSGTIDSLGLLDLINALQEHCGREIDFDLLDPEQMTVVGPLCDFVAGQMAKG